MQAACLTDVRALRDYKYICAPDLVVAQYKVCIAVGSVNYGVGCLPCNFHYHCADPVCCYTVPLWVSSVGKRIHISNHFINVTY